MLSQRPHLTMGFLFLLIPLILCSSAMAQSTGTVKGYLSDAKYGYYLEGARVTAEDSKTEVRTDSDGFYRITLPEGRQKLVFKYEGYEPVSREVEVIPGEAAALDVRMGEESLELSEMVVKGRLYGEMRALNRQKATDAFKNIVSSDAIGNLPDQNVAEATSRLPGISLARDQGEGRFVVIRGIDPDLNSTGLAGVPLFSPDDSDRAVLLDVIPSDIVESLRVSKTVLPDEPHDGIGGHVEIEMPSAFDKEGRTLKGTLQANHDDLAEETNGRFSMTYGDRFGAGEKFGFLGALSYDKREIASDNQESEPWELEDGKWVPDEMEFREYDLTRERWGVVANLEYRPKGGDQYFIRGNYNEMEDEEIRRALIYEVDELGAFDNFAGTADWEVANELKDRTETMSEYVLSAGGKNIFDQLEIDYLAGYAHSEEDTPDDTETVYALDDVFEGDYSGGSGYHPQIRYASGLDAYDPANYVFDELEDQDQVVEVANWYGKTNIRQDLDTALPAYVKIGGNLLFSERTNDTETFKSNANPSSFDTLEGNTGSGRQKYFDSNVPITDDGLIGRARGRLADFDMERDEVDSFVEDYENNENIYAGYVMGGITFNEMKIIGGVRVEYTDFESQGYQVGDGIRRQSTADNSYTNALPGLHYRWNMDDDLVLRASWTNTIARPTHEEARNAMEIDDGDVEKGNPDLDPYQSMNFDVSVRYYLAELSMIQVAGFYKDIEDFIFQQTFQNASDYGGDLTTYDNATSGEIYGIELGYQQQFQFLPSPLDGVGLNANLTLTDSEGTVPATGDQPARDIPFVRQSDSIGNISLFYEKYGFSFRVAGSYRDDYLDELGEVESEDRYMDDHFQVDISTSYAVNDNFTVYADVVNLNEEPLRAYWDKSGALSQYEAYGRQIRGGLQWRF